MTSPKAKFQRPHSHRWFTEFNDEHRQLLRSIKDDDSFVRDITHMANDYAARKRNLKNSLSLGDARKTLNDLQSSAYSMAEKLDNLPFDLEVTLWRLRAPWLSNMGLKLNGDDSASLSTLLRDLADEISRVVSDDLIEGKAGRKETLLEQTVADDLRSYFSRHGMGHSRSSKALIDCLDIIFGFGKTHLSHEALAVYLKKKTIKKG